MTNGTRSIQIEADALEATAFDSTISAIADTRHPSATPTEQTSAAPKQSA